MSRRRDRQRAQERQRDRPGLQETEIQKWKRLYADNVKLKKRMGPAYNKAVAPFLASVINHFNRPKIRVLVLGGGTGVFTRELMPAIRTSLGTLKCRTKIEIVETDLTDAIHQAPSEVTRFKANANNLPFQNESFDLVVGQSMIHQTDLAKSIPEIKRVMNGHGLFFHVQDDTPNPAQFLPRTGSSQIRGRSKDERRAFHQLSQAAHNGLTAQVIHHAKIHELKNAAIEVSGDALVPRKHKIGTYSGINLDKGHGVLYQMGSIKVIKDDRSIPKDKRKLSYVGRIILLSKSQIRPVLERVQTNFGHD